MARLVEVVDGVAPLDEATLLILRNHPSDAISWGDVWGFGLFKRECVL